MKNLLVIFFLCAGLPGHSQLYYPGISAGMPINNFNYHPLGGPQSKWSYNTFAQVNAGMSFYNGGGGYFVSVPVGLQVNRQLNNHFTAFANAWAAPTYFDMSRSLMYGGNKNYMVGSSLYNSLGMQTGVSLGLQYVNEDRTFSITGSISVQRGDYYAPVRYGSRKDVK
jgi:hypothetical protein